MNPAESPGLPPTGAAGPTAETTQAAADSLPVASPPASRSLPDPTDQLEQEFRNVRRAGGFYAAMLLPLLVATGWSYHTRSSAVEIDFWTAGALYTVIAVCATLWRRDWLHLVRLPSGGSRRWLVAVGLIPLVSISAAELLHHWALSFGLPVQDIMAGYGGDGYPVWLLALGIIVLAPVFEEVAFRGVLVAQLQRVMTPVQAVWVAAIMFGVLHLSALSMEAFLVPLGAVAGFLTRATKSLLPAIAIHAAHNAGVLLFSL